MIIIFFSPCRVVCGATLQNYASTLLSVDFPLDVASIESSGLVQDGGKNPMLFQLQYCLYVYQPPLAFYYSSKTYLYCKQYTFTIISSKMYLFVYYLYRLVNSCFYKSLLFLTVVNWYFDCPSSDPWEPLQADSHDILIGYHPCLGSLS